MKLFKGNKGKDVVSLQETLKKKGLKVEVTGTFDDLTEMALKEVQKSLGVSQDGVLGDWVSTKLDLKETEKTPSTNNKTITLTAGHSNVDPGAVNRKVKESDIAVELRNGVATVLRSRGIDVKKDGEDNCNLSLNEAIKIVDKSKLSVEFHLNSSTNTAAKGVEALSLAKDKLLCQEICKAISECLGIPVRGSEGGWKPQDSGQHARLGYCLHGGIIVETFFISNQEELSKYNAKKAELFVAIANVLERGINT